MMTSDRQKALEALEHLSRNLTIRPFCPYDPMSNEEAVAILRQALSTDTVEGLLEKIPEHFTTLIKLMALGDEKAAQEVLKAATALQELKEKENG